MFGNPFNINMPRFAIVSNKIVNGKVSDKDVIVKCNW